METVVSLVQLCPEPITRIFVVCVVFGAFGGLVAHFLNNEKKDVSLKDDKSAWFLYPSYFQSALIGLAGGNSVYVFYSCCRRPYNFLFLS